LLDCHGTDVGVQMVVGTGLNAPHRWEGCWDDAVIGKRLQLCTAGYYSRLHKRSVSCVSASTYVSSVSTSTHELSEYECVYKEGLQTCFLVLSLLLLPPLPMRPFV
jgi:hypothetical protein